MLKFTRSAASATIAIALAGGVYAYLGSPMVSVTRADHIKNHPKLAKAYDALRAAHDELKGAPGTFHGHKEEALGSIDAALHAIQQYVEEMPERRGSSDRRAEKLAGYPRLEAALADIKEARTYVEESKGGDPVRKKEALKAMDDAIHQIHRIIEDRD